MRLASQPVGQTVDQKVQRMVMLIEKSTNVYQWSSTNDQNEHDVTVIMTNDAN